MALIASNAYLLAGYKDAPARRIAWLARTTLCYRRPRSPGGLAAIGDSITAGSGGWSSAGFLPVTSWFSHAIAIADLPFNVNAALPNQATEWIASRLAGDALARCPGVVAIMAGTNDVLNGLPIERPLRLIARMVAECRAAGAEPVLLTLPPYEVAGRAVPDFNRALRELADDRRVTIIDAHTAVAGDGRYGDGMSDDGLHPNRHGARAIGEVAAPVLGSVLADCHRRPMRRGTTALGGNTGR